MRNCLALLLVFSLVSCDYFKQESNGTPVARVNDSYLYESDIASLVTDSATPEDSASIVNNYITRWATQQLLIDQAKINLPEAELQNYERLVQDYQADLYTEAYKSVIVSKQLDSTVTQAESQQFYEANKENFKLNEPLYRVRYIQVEEEFTNVAAIGQKLDRFSEEDQEELYSLSIQFTAHSFNDSLWVKQETLLEAIPALVAKSEQVLKKSNFARLQDSLGLYLVKIQDKLVTNDIAPLSYVQPTITQIILNKRKLELIKKLEKDITKDAIKNKSFETYPQN